MIHALFLTADVHSSANLKRNHWSATGMRLNIIDMAIANHWWLQSWGMIFAFHVDSFCKIWLNPYVGARFPRFRHLISWIWKFCEHFLEYQWIGGIRNWTSLILFKFSHNAFQLGVVCVRGVVQWGLYTAGRSVHHKPIWTDSWGVLELLYFGQCVDVGTLTMKMCSRWLGQNNNKPPIQAHVKM